MNTEVKAVHFYPHFLGCRSSFVSNAPIFIDARWTLLKKSFPRAAQAGAVSFVSRNAPSADYL